MIITVLMSTYNGEKYLREQIDSILAQEGDFTVRLVVRDDGSSDSTTDILEEYAAQGRLTWYTGENLKPAKSFLDLVCTTKESDLYAFADQDDYWYPDKLYRAKEALKDRQGPAIYATNALLVDGQRNCLGRNVYTAIVHVDFYSLAMAANVMGCTCVFNEPLAKALRSHMPDKLIMHDSYAAVLCAFLGGSVIYDHRPSMDYRQHGANVVGSQWKKTSALKDRIRKITKARNVSVAEQAQSLLEGHAAAAENEEKLAFLRKIAGYRRNVFKAARLALSCKPKYQSRNMAVTTRLAVLFRHH